MTANLAAIGTILKGRHDSNPDARAKVWAVNPDNPNRVLLWAKSGRFSWNKVSSLDVNYELAPADEPTWPDPTRPPPPDVPRSPKKKTPVEIAAEAPDPAPTVDTSEPDNQDDEPEPEEAPPPAPPLAKTSGQVAHEAHRPAANDDSAAVAVKTVTVTLTGEPAQQLHALVDYLRHKLRGTGARISPTSFIEDLVEREYGATVKDLVRRELAATGKEVA